MQHNVDSTQKNMTRLSSYRSSGIRKKQTTADIQMARKVADSTMRMLTMITVGRPGHNIYIWIFKIILHSDYSLQKLLINKKTPLKTTNVKCYPKKQTTTTINVSRLGHNDTYTRIFNIILHIYYSLPKLLLNKKTPINTTSARMHIRRGIVYMQ